MAFFCQLEKGKLVTSFLIKIVSLTLVISCSSVFFKNDQQKNNVPDESSRKNAYEISVNNDLFIFKSIPSLELNQKNYLVDLDGDKVDELITLENSYSKPNIFSLKRDRLDFKKLKNNSSVHRASFIKINPTQSNKKFPVGLFTFFQNDFMPPSSGLFYEVVVNGEEVSFFKIGSVNEKQKLPLTSVLHFEPTGEKSRKPIGFYFHWLKNIDNVLTPVIDQYTDGRKLKNLNTQSREQANYGASLCDVDNDEVLEAVLSSTSNDSLQYLNFDKKNGFKKEELFTESNAPKGIFASCFYEFNKTKKPRYVIGGLSRDYFKNINITGVFDHHGKLIYDFNIYGNNDSKNILTLDLNGDIYWDFVIENNGHPPHSKLEVFLSDNGKYKKLNGLDIINPSGVVYSDFNNDGKIDLLFGRSTTRAPYIDRSGGILINSIKPKGRSLRLFFDGHESFKDGEGGIIEVVTSGGKVKKIIQYQEGGLPSQSSRFIQFGLGEFKPLKATLTLGAQKIIYNFDLKRKVKEITLCPGGNYKVGNKSCD